MRCPNCGSPVSIFGTKWECGWCGDSGFIKRVQPDEPESDDEYDDEDEDEDEDDEDEDDEDDEDGVTITVTISAAESDDESEPEKAEKPLSEIPDDGTIFHYCSVMVSVSSRPYAYLTGGLPLKVGDIVEVPFGSGNAIWRGEVVEVMNRTRSDAPWPPEKTKTVSRVVPPQVTEPGKEDKPRIYEKTNTKKEFPYGKLIAGILIADVIAIIALILMWHR